MKSKCIWILGLILLCVPSFSLLSQSIAEKKANLKSSESDLDQETENFLLQINKETQEIHARIQRLYDEVMTLYRADAPPEQYRELLNQINELKRHLTQMELTWRELVAKSNRAEGYGLWHAPDTTLEQLIIDYGSQDFVYLIPPEVGGIKLSIDSNLPIPRASWSEMLELIMSQNGVGVKTLNPYLRQLYLTKQNNSHLRLITNKREDLLVLPPESRISFVLSPEPSEVRRTFSFLEKFINPATTVLQILGRDILLIGPSGEIQDLLRLYDFISVNRGEKDFRLLPIYKMQAEEMSKILGAIFDHSDAPIQTSSNTPGGGNRSSASDVNGLKIIVLENMSQALFLVGTREEVRKAEEIVRSVESQVGGARDKVVFWYTVKHSEAEELADVLYRVYSLMITTGTGMESSQGGPDGGQNKVIVTENNGVPPQDLSPQKEPPASLYQPEGFYQEGGYIVNPAPAQPRVFEATTANNDRDNFIVDVKTGAIVMVIEADIVPKMKDLLRKLDVPKKMVQIETLMFEKVLNRQNQMGLNLLKIGDAASNHHKSGALFNSHKHDEKHGRHNKHGRHDNHHGHDILDDILGGKGVFEFFLSRKWTDSGIPAFDLVYRFLLSQDDVQINSNPSLLTVNQTPATIAINEEISINTGIFEVETAKGNTLKDSFTRAQYGITISVKPTIHLAQDDDDEANYDYITLETDITFDSPNGGKPDRPDVTRRHITNLVQVPDGDTVILGGLRRKISADSREAIPFLGELPGVGKLFSTNVLSDKSTEMFIFITPHIIKDPKEQLTCLRQELLCLRPGDLPYFLQCVEEAHRYERSRLMEGSMTLLFGPPRGRYYDVSASCSAGCPQECMGEYDGR